MGLHILDIISTLCGVFGHGHMIHFERGCDANMALDWPTIMIG
jgi:hypothetical protein